MNTRDITQTKRLAKLRYTLLGMLIIALLTATVVPAIAAQTSIQLTAQFSNIKIVIDGEQIEPKDASGKTVEPFIVDGTTSFELF